MFAADRFQLKYSPAGESNEPSCSYGIKIHITVSTHFIKYSNCWSQLFGSRLKYTAEYLNLLYS